MKFLVALSCVLAVACAKPSGVAVASAPLAYSNVVNHVGAPLAYSNVVNHVGAPLAYSNVVSHIGAPLAYSNVVSHAAAPVAYSAYSVSSNVISAPIAHTVAAAPVAHAVAAPVAHAVVAPIVQKTQYHAQDELGQASYGHSEPLQAHNAVQDAAGNKVGSYSYVAPDGQVIAANYVADALGFRVASNALPVGPAVLPVAPIDTPEVAAAKAAHLNAHALVKSRARRGIVASYGAPVAVHGAYAAPVYAHSAYAAPVLRAATLSTVVNTPGHAVSYNVY